VVDGEGALVAETVRPGEDVLVYFAIFAPEIEESEVGAFGEDVAVFEERSDFALMAIDEVLVGGLVVARAFVLHAVLFGEGFDLAVAEHGQTGEGGHHGADAKVFVPGAELIDRSPFIGVAHEVNVSLENIRIELNRVLNNGAVLSLSLIHI